MELQGNIVYLWKKKIILLEHIYNFVRKTTSEPRCCCNVNVRSENRRRKHDVVTTLVFGGSNGVHIVVTTLSDVATKLQPKANVVTTPCAS